MTSEERKAWERKQRENRIVDIAQDIYFKKGYEETTIIEIAEAAGYNKRSIYLYFRDKEEIFLAVVLRGLKIMLEMVKTASETKPQNGNILRSIGEAFFRFSLKHPEFLKLVMIYESNHCIYYHAGDALKEERGCFADECQKTTDAIADIMTGTIRKAIDSGHIRTDLTPVQLMLILWGEVFGVMQIILMRKEHFEDAFGISYRRLFESFLDMVETSLSS